MKKLVSTVVVLILALCLATTAFAAQNQIFNVSAIANLPESITLEAGSSAIINITDYTVMGRYLKVSGGDSQVTIRNWDSTTSVEGVSIIRLQGRGTCNITIKNTGTATTTYAVSLYDPLGTLYNPEAIPEEVAANCIAAEQHYYYFDVVTDGTFIVDGVTATEGTDSYNVMLSIDGFIESYADILDGAGKPTSGTSMAVKAGDRLVICVAGMDYDGQLETVTVSFTTSFASEHANIVHVEAVGAGCHSDGNIEYWKCSDCGGCWIDEALTTAVSAAQIVVPATGAENVEHVEAVEVGCHNNGNAEYWICGGCSGTFTEEGCFVEIEEVDFTATGSTDITHVEAQEVSCHRNGVQEHWICNDCGGYFADEACTQQIMQPRSLIIPAEVTLEYHEKVNATCTENGMEEYWYCAKCDCFFTDAEGVFNVASKRLVIEATGKEHELEYYDAVEPTCHKNGNAAYAYCAKCDCYFIDVEGNLVNTNAKNIVILAQHALERHEKVDATCTENGMEEYWYCAKCDCFFTDAEGKYNIASKRLTIVAAGHNYVDGVCTVCNAPNPSTGDTGIMGVVVILLTTVMSTVALIAKKKEF